MYCVEMKETHQRNMMSKVRVNFDMTRYFNDIQEVHENIESLQKGLEKMDIIQVKTWREQNLVARRIEYSRPNQIGHQVRTIVVRKYNPPKKAELI